MVGCALKSLSFKLFLHPTDTVGIVERDCKEEEDDRSDEGTVERIELSHGPDDITEEQADQKGEPGGEHPDVGAGLLGMADGERNVKGGDALVEHQQQIDKHAHGGKDQYGPCLAIAVDVAHGIPVERYDHLVGREVEPQCHGHHQDHQQQGRTVEPFSHFAVRMK